VNCLTSMYTSACEGSGRAKRRQTSYLTVFLLAALLVGCASRPESGFLSPVAVARADASDHTLLVATTREHDARPGTLFNGDRASSLDYAEIAVSIPPTHVQGQIEWAATPPGDPATNFVARDEKYLDGDKAFIQAPNVQFAARSRGSRKVFVFIRGFNTLFAEGLYRTLQIVHDAKSMTRNS
jgi:esterase/lipase superfamily enzyme